MNSEQYYQNTLEEILHILCDAMGIEPERYDRDQADGEVYKDCAKDAATIIEWSGYKFDDDAGEFVKEQDK